MSKYIGSNCLVCDKQFTDEDNIVVCPDCGTPYHRKCYFKEEKCINIELHEQNKTWAPIIKDISEQEISEVKCHRCGELNPQTGLFCLKCGTPINNVNQSNSSTQNTNPSLFTLGQNFGEKTESFSAESKIDGIKIKDYNQYIQKNPFFYIPQFIKFDKIKSKFSLNIVAMIFPEYFFFYRKMNFYGVIFLMLKILMQVPYIIAQSRTGYLSNTAFSDVFLNTLSDEKLTSLLSYANFLNYGIMFVCAVFANWVYYIKVKKDINNINSEDISEEEKSNRIKEKGGVSPRNVFIAAIVPFAIALIALIIKTYI